MGTLMLLQIIVDPFILLLKAHCLIIVASECGAYFKMQKELIMCSHICLFVNSEFAELPQLSDTVG